MNIFLKNNKNIYFKWFIIDVNNKILGRISTKIISYLINKYKKEKNIKYNLIVINSIKLKISGNKKIKKIYYSHSRYPGGLHKINFNDMKKKFPCKILFKSLKGMLPKNFLGNKILKKIKIYPNNKHFHIYKKISKLKI